MPRAALHSTTSAATDRRPLFFQLRSGTFQLPVCRYSVRTRVRRSVSESDWMLGIITSIAVDERGVHRRAADCTHAGSGSRAL